MEFIKDPIPDQFPDRLPNGFGREFGEKKITFIDETRLLHTGPDQRFGGKVFALG